MKAVKEFSKKFVVGSNDTAKEIGSGDLEVLATPVMITMVENTAKEYLHKQLAPEETSVGTLIEARHLRPSVVGAQMTVKVKVASQEKTKINFSFEVFDNGQVVATGIHQRAVILTDVFLEKLAHPK
ncbi:thioesterase family protein [Enterococcus rotai]|uniref:thioesterase family protein n=1 Tax=Enterococcus rotai TaxID=118060 RepID=UPI0035C776F8